MQHHNQAAAEAIKSSQDKAVAFKDVEEVERQEMEMGSDEDEIVTSEDTPHQAFSERRKKAVAPTLSLPANRQVGEQYRF